MKLNFCQCWQYLSLRLCAHRLFDCDSKGSLILVLTSTIAAEDAKRCRAEEVEFVDHLSKFGGEFHEGEDLGVAFTDWDGFALASSLLLLLQW